MINTTNAELINTNMWKYSTYTLIIPDNTGHLKSSKDIKCKSEPL